MCNGVLLKIQLNLVEQQDGLLNQWRRLLVLATDPWYGLNISVLYSNIYVINTVQLVFFFELTNVPCSTFTVVTCFEMLPSNFACQCTQRRQSFYYYSKQFSIYLKQKWYQQ